MRTREIFRQWGIEERFLDAGVLRRRLTLHNAVPGRRPLLAIDFSELDAETDSPGILLLEQGYTEKLLLEVVQESGMCDVRFGAEVVGLAPREDGARVTIREGGESRALDAEFVVGCDGASSFVRNALGLPFEGITYSIRPMLADVCVVDERDALPWPLLDRRARSAGVRLPNPPLRSREGAEVRLYDLLPNGPVILSIGQDCDLPGNLPVEEVIRIGPGGYLDPTGSLSGLLGGQHGWILVRPDAMRTSPGRGTIWRESTWR